MHAVPKKGPPGGPIFGTVFRFIFLSFWYQGCRSAAFWLHMHLCQLRSPRGSRLDSFSFCLSFRRVYFWARKRQEKLETQIRASPVQSFRSPYRPGIPPFPPETKIKVQMLQRIIISFLSIIVWRGAGERAQI